MINFASTKKWSGVYKARSTFDLTAFDNEFDLMRGNEEYKFRFGGVNRYMMKGILKR